MALAVEGDGRVSRRVLLEACPALPAEAITALHALGDDQGVEDVVAALLGADQARAEHVLVVVEHQRGAVVVIRSQKMSYQKVGRCRA